MHGLQADKFVFCAKAQNHRSAEARLAGRPRFVKSERAYSCGGPIDRGVNMKRIAANFVKRFFEKRGYTITRPRFHEENAIDLRVMLAEPIERRKGSFTVLQIGANDGVTNDPIHDAVVRRGWKLIAVEPMPASFARLQQTYRGNPNITCVQCAIGTEDGESPIYSVRPRAQGETGDDQLASFSLETLRSHWRGTPGLDKRIEKYMVKSLSFKSLVAKYFLDNVDMLQIDVEGFDYQIITAAFQIQLFPEILAFEWWNLGKEKMWQCRSDLIKHGYRWLIDKGDVIAVRSGSDNDVAVRSDGY